MCFWFVWFRHLMLVRRQQLPLRRNGLQVTQWTDSWWGWPKKTEGEENVKAVIQLSLETDSSKTEVASVQRILRQIRLDQTEGELLNFCKDCGYAVVPSCYILRQHARWIQYSDTTVQRQTGTIVTVVNFTALRAPKIYTSKCFFPLREPTVLWNTNA